MYEQGRMSQGATEGILGRDGRILCHELEWALRRLKDKQFNSSAFLSVVHYQFTVSGSYYGVLISYSRSGYLYRL